MDELKREVLAAYHILDTHGQNAGIAGHLTARAPGAQDFWCHGYGQGFEEVRAADLHNADMTLRVLSGPGRVNPSLVIHTALYRVRPDVGCVIHTHSPSAVMLTATGSELLPLFQSALMFHEDCALHAQRRQTKRDAFGQAQQLPVRHGVRLPGHAVEVGHGHLVEAARCDFIQKIEQGFVVPVAAGPDFLNQLGAQLGFDHVVSLSLH